MFGCSDVFLAFCIRGLGWPDPKKTWTLLHSARALFCLPRCPYPKKKGANCPLVCLPEIESSGPTTQFWSPQHISHVTSVQNNNKSAVATLIKKICTRWLHLRSAIQQTNKKSSFFRTQKLLPRREIGRKYPQSHGEENTPKGNQNDFYDKSTLDSKCSKSQIFITFGKW